MHIFAAQSEKHLLYLRFLVLPTALTLLAYEPGGYLGEFIQKKKGNNMNSNVTPSRIVMGTDELNNLVKETKETIAANNETQKEFTVVDLWQIQKQMKSATRFTKRWNLN
jgi:hypothetical protein